MTELELLVADGSISGQRGPVLEAINLEIPRAATTVILGPAGTGKSALLRALSGISQTDGWSRGGRWQTSAGATLAPDLGRLYCPQLRRDEQVRCDGWRTALHSRASTVLLDEPAVGCSESEVEELISLICEPPKRTVLLITHNLRLARAVADFVCFVCAGAASPVMPAHEFFDRPPSELAARFIATGNCWPKPEPPALPSHFRWVIDGKLAGMGRPGLLRDVELDLTAIASAGVGLLVSLTEKPFPPAELRPYAINHRHFPIDDMGVPAIGPTASLCGYIERQMERDCPVVVHCRAGLGRTGLLLAAMLTWLGKGADEAMAQVRVLRSGYIQNRAQENFVRRFAAEMGG